MQKQELGWGMIVFGTAHGTCPIARSHPAVVQKIVRRPFSSRTGNPKLRFGSEEANLEYSDYSQLLIVQNGSQRFHFA